MREDTYMDNIQTNYQDRKKLIKTELNNVATSFVVIGYELKQIRDNELYKEDGYSNINEFAKAEYSLSQSTTSRFIAINDKYSVDGSSPKLLEQYEGFGYSKLSEMLTMDQDELNLVSIHTTRAEIREIKQAKKEYENNIYAPAHNPESLDITQSNPISREPGKHVIPDAEKLLIDFFRDKSRRDILYQLGATLRSWGGSLTDLEVKAPEIINPSGYLFHRKGMVILTFESETIKYSKFGAQPMEFTYGDLIHDIDLVFDLLLEDPWVAFYGEPEPDPIAEEPAEDEEDIEDIEETIEQDNEAEPVDEDEEIEKLDNTEEIKEKKEQVIEEQQDEAIEIENSKDILPDIEESFEVYEAEIVESKKCKCHDQAGHLVFLKDNATVSFDGILGKLMFEYDQGDEGIFTKTIDLNYCPLCAKEYMHERP